MFRRVAATATALAVGVGVGIGVPSAHAANGWGTAQLVDLNPDTNGFGTSNLTISGDGTQAVYLRRGASTPEEVTTSTRTFGTWEPAQSVAQGSLNTPTDPAIALDGDVFVVQFNNSGVRGIYVSRYANGAWGPYDQVNPTPDPDHWGLNPSISGDGNTIAWIRQNRNTSVKDVHVSTYSGGAWSSVGPLDDSGRDVTTSFPIVSEDGRTVVWHEEPRSFPFIGQVWAARLVNGTWEAARVSDPADDVISSTGQQPRPSADGKTIIYNVDATGSNKNYVRVVKRTGDTWGNPETLSSSLDDVEYIGLAGDGNTVVWQQEDPATDAVWTRRFSDGAWQPEVRVSPQGTRGEIPNNTTRMLSDDGTQLVYRSNNNVQGARWVGGAWQLTELAYPTSDGANWINIAGSGATVAWASQGPQADNFPNWVLASTSPQPGPPRTVAASAGEESAEVMWSPGFDGTAPTTSYTVQAFKDGSEVAGKTCTVSSPLPNPLKCTVPGLTAGVEYTFKVTAANSNGDSDLSDHSNAVTPTAAPVPPVPPTPPGGAPTLTRVAAGDKQLTATWTAPTSGGAVKSYRAVAGPGGKSCTVAAPALSCVITGLDNNVKYTVRVVAVTDGGDSPDSNAMDGVPRVTGAQGAGASKKSKKPGRASLVVQGQRVPPGTSTFPRRGQTVFSDGEWQLGIKPVNGQGNPQIVIDRALQPERGQFVQVTAGGFLPKSRARVFLFSKTYDLGEVTVRDDGTISQRLRVPKGVPAGDHTIQVNGYSYDGMARSASLGVVIRDAAATLTAVRKSTKATVQVFPQCAAQYPFTMQRKTDEGWSSLGKMRTKGEQQRRTMDLEPGTYRAKVAQRCDNPAVMTDTIRIGPRKPGKG